MRVEFKSNPKVGGTALGDANLDNKQYSIVKLDVPQYIAPDVLISIVVVQTSQIQPESTS